MIIVLSLISLAFAADPTTNVDAAAAGPCRAFGHSVVALDGTAVWTPVPQCTRPKMVNVLVDSQVKLTAANTAATVAVTDASNQQALIAMRVQGDVFQKSTEAEATFATVALCQASMAKDGNVRCVINGNVVERVSDKVGVAKADGVNRWPDGYGGYGYGVGHLSTAQALDAMDRAEQMLNNQPPATTSHDRQVDVPPVDAPKLDKFQEELNGS